MKTTTLVLFILCTATTLFAQEKKATRNTPWATLLYKNEVSLDISPVFLLMLTDFHSEGVALTYRRFVNRSNAFRVGYRSTFLNDDLFRETESFGYRTISGSADSITVFTDERTENQKTRWHTLHLGYEHRFGKRRVKFVLGVDMITGLEKWEDVKTDYRYQSTVAFDSSGNTYTAGVVYPFFEFTSVETINSFMLGFTPVLGLQVHLAKRWSLNASLLFDLYWRHPVRYNSNANGSDLINSFNLVTEAPVADVSLTFHF